MDYSKDLTAFLAARLGSAWKIPPFASSCLALFGILLLSAAAQFLLSHGPQIPIALSDQITNRKKRVDQYRIDSRNILNQGYAKFKGQIFGIDTSEGTAVVLPTDFMEELKSNPHLTFAATFDTLTLPEYTWIKPLSPQVVKLFTAKVNPSLGDMIPETLNMFRNELLKKLPDSQDWKPVKVYPIFFNLVCKSAARALLGEAAAKDDAWIQMESDYISTAIPYIQLLKKWPKFLRPLVYRKVEGYKTLRRQWGEGRAFIAGLLEQKKAANWAPLQNPPSFFDHIASQFKDMSVDDHLAIQITLFIAGVHTSAATATQSVFDAVVNSACVKEIQQEVREMNEQNKGSWTRQDLGQLVKLDSFIKEVLRLSSPDLVTFVRKSSQEVILSNGFRIPKGAKIEVPTGAIGMDEEMHENPKAFDGLRYWRLRQQEDQALKHQLTTVGKHDLIWGYGRHACPGRYMAEITIKLLLSQVFLHFEMKSLPGQGRPANIEFDGQTMPDTEAEVLMRRIQT